jgi:hypothetical protein
VAKPYDAAGSSNVELREGDCSFKLTVVSFSNYGAWEKPVLDCVKIEPVTP